MKISEYIQHLQRLQATHGDLDVETDSTHEGRRTAAPPRIDYRRILQGRERRPEFTSSYYGPDANSRRGEKVCRVE